MEVGWYRPRLVTGERRRRQHAGPCGADMQEAERVKGVQLQADLWRADRR
jgi:hypothetical protein